MPKGRPQELLNAFKVAVSTINDMRASPTVSPDSTAYGLFLKSCTQLMPPSVKREAVVENVFRKCCSDGQVGENVLGELNAAASKTMCRRLLGGNLEDGVSIPIEWSRNVKDRRGKRR